MESVGGEQEEAGDVRWVGTDKVVGVVLCLEAAVMVGSGVLGRGVIATGFTREGKGIDGKSDDGSGNGVQVAAAVVECNGEGDVIDVSGLVVAGGGAGIGSVDDAGNIIGVVVAAGVAIDVGVEGVGDVDKADIIVEVVVAVAGVSIGGVKGAWAFAGDGAVCNIDKAGNIVGSVLDAVAIGSIAEMQG